MLDQLLKRCIDPFANSLCGGGELEKKLDQEAPVA
jgi:hypothetical protein